MAAHEPPPPGDPEPGEDFEPEDDPEPEPEPEPPPPQQWFAAAELAPVKGSKMKPGVVSFSQTEGEGVHVTTSELKGLKTGTYHLVIHESADCGKNATKAGGAWPDAAGVELVLVVTKKDPGMIDQEGLELMLEGDQSIAGHALVLHADKKGKPGKAVACGSIEIIDASAEDDGASEDEVIEEE